LQPREIGFECNKTFEIMRGCEEVDEGQRRLHAARLGRIVLPAEHRIQPCDAAAAPAQEMHFSSELGWFTGVVAIRDDHDSGSRMNHAAGMPAVESGKTVSYPRAAAHAGRDERETLHSTCHIFFAQRRRDMYEPCVENKGLGLEK